MNKIKILFVLFLGLISSSFFNLNKYSSEDDPLVGTWVMEKVVYKYSDQEPSELIIVKCSNKTQYTYKSDGTLLYKTFLLDDTTEECTVEGNDYWIGTWERKMNGDYKRSLINKYNDEILSKYDDSTDVFVFSNNNNLLEKITVYAKAGIVIEGTTLVSEHAFFTRLKE